MALIFCYHRDDQVIAVVYFRAGYSPSDYHSESVSCCPSIFIC